MNFPSLRAVPALTSMIKQTMRATACENGGIGRHARLRTLWLQGCEGSSPSSRTAIPRAVFLLAVFFVLGCTDTPEHAVHTLIQAANSKDTELLRERISRRSLPLLNLALEYGEAAPAISLPTTVSPYRIHRLVPVGGGITYVEVEQNSTLFRLPMIRERGRWRLDLLLLGDDTSHQPIPLDSGPLPPPLK